MLAGELKTGRSLAQIADGDFSSLHDLHGKLAPMEHAHPQKRLAFFYHIHVDETRLALPGNDRGNTGKNLSRPSARVPSIVP
jgi:hypothetical protein